MFKESTFLLNGSKHFSKGLIHSVVNNNPVDD